MAFIPPPIEMGQSQMAALPQGGPSQKREYEPSATILCAGSQSLRYSPRGGVLIC